MVEINNQRKAFLDMLASDENQKSWLWRHCRRRAIYWLLRSPRKLVTLNPKLKSTGADATSFFCCGCLPQAAWPERLLSEKSGRCGYCSRLRSVALYLWLIVVISVRQSTAARTSSTAKVAAGCLYKADSLIAKFKEAGGTVRRDWCMSRVTAIISALVICIIVCLPRAVNHYRDTAITYKAQRDKNARELKLANAVLRHADASWMLQARCKIHEGVSWC